MWNGSLFGRLVAVGVLVGSTAAQAEADPFKTSRLTREQLVEAVLSRNPTIESARLAWEAARAEASGAGGLPDPTVMVEVAPASPFGAHGFGAGVMLSQQLPWPGKRALAVRRQEAAATSAKFEWEAAQRELAVAASLLFDDYYLVHRALEIDAEHRALLEDFQRAAASRFSAGMAPMQDPLQAESELAGLLEREVSLNAEKHVIAARINRLLHRPAGAALPPPPDVLSPIEVVSDELEPRPELRAAEARIAAADADRSVAEAAYRPDFEVSTSYSSMWDDPTHRWMVGVGVNVPIWQDRLKAEKRAAEARVARARSEAADLLNDMRFELDAARVRVEAAKGRLAVQADRLLPAAQDFVAAALSAVETGEGSFLALITAERNQRAARLSYETTLVELSKAQAELALALGHYPVRIPAETEDVR